MDSALVIGGTRFIGRHLVDELLDHDYAVTIFNRGKHDNPFEDREDVEHIEGDRNERTDLRTAAMVSDADAVFDCVAYHPGQVEEAVDIFDDVDAYVYVSSGGAYGAEEIPKREDETDLCECTPEQAEDDSPETYGPRKAEGDRVIFEAAGASRADEGVNAMSVRPTVVYGPHDYTERFDYWLDRVANHDRVVVPGDGDNIWHRVYVEDVASALRIVAEDGTPGEAYNVGDRRLTTLEEQIEMIAERMGTDTDIVTAGARELEAGGLAPTDFPLYRDYPHILDTHKLESLGWESTPLAEALDRTIAEHRESDRTGREQGPDREAEERVLDVLEMM